MQIARITLHKFLFNFCSQNFCLVLRKIYNWWTMDGFYRSGNIFSVIFFPSQSFKERKPINLDEDIIRGYNLIFHVGESRSYFTWY